MKKLKLFLSLLMLMTFSVGTVWAETCTLTSAQIKSGSGTSSYGDCSATDGCSKTWNAYAIKNQHSKATSAYNFWQIKKYASSTAYYVQVPEMDGNITSLKITVSNTSKARDGGGNTATLYFSASNSTSSTGTGVASGTGDSEITINCSSLKLATGYITTSAAIRIWDVEVTYAAPQPTVLLAPASLAFGNVEQEDEVEAKTFTITGSDLTGALTVTSTNAAFSAACTSGSLTPTAGAVSATITVTPNTENAGEFSGNIKVNGGGLGTDTALVAVSMNVTAKSAVTITNPTNGTVTVKHGETTLSSGDKIVVGETLNVSYAPKVDNAYRGTLKYKVGAGEWTNVENGTISMPAEAITISADEEELYAVAVAVNNNEMGSATINSVAGPVYVAYAEDVTLVATPNAGYEFVNWTVSTEDIEITEADKTKANGAKATIGAAGTITANFKVSETAQVLGAPEALDFGTAKQHYAAPKTKEEFTLTGANLTADLTLTAPTGFTVAPTTITAAEVMAEGGVKVTVTPSTENAGIFDGNLTIASADITTINVALTYSVTETFLVQVAVNDANFGSATIEDAASYYAEALEEFDLVATPEEGYRFVNWTVAEADKEDVVITSATSASTTAYVDKALTVTANFELIPSYTANWYVNGSKVDSQEAYAGVDLKTFPSDFSSFTDCSELEFQGWLTAPLAETSASKPAGLITETEGLKMPAEDVNYYAVFATKEGTDVPAGYSLSTSAPANGDKVIITRLVSGTYYALKTDVATTALTITDGVVSEPADGVIWDLAEATYGFYVYPTGQTNNSLHLNSSALKVAAGTTNGDIGFSANGDNSFKAARYNSETADRWIVVSGTNGLGCSATEANAAALYIFKYSAGSSATRKDYVTTCPSCTEVELNAVAVEHGSIALSSTLVKTCDLAKVTVTPDPATGYELTNVALSGVAGATYADGEISIPAEASGTLDVTATFSQINYTVTMAQTGEASSTISSNQNNKHYNDVITVTATAVDGYYFLGWVADVEVAFDNAKALETTFPMPNSNVTVTAKFAKILTISEAIPLIPNEGDTYDNAVVEGYISSAATSDKEGTLTYNIRAIDANGFLTGSELQVFRGKGINGANFSNLDDVKIGAKVFIYGQLKNYYGTRELNSNNYLLSYDAGSYLGVDIYGEATETEYEVGDEFKFDGLSAKHAWSNGYAEAIASPIWAADPTIIAANTTSVSVTAKDDDNTSAPVEVDVTVLTHAVTFSAPDHGTLVVKNAGAAITSGDAFVKGTILTVEAIPASIDYMLTALTAGEESIIASKQFEIGTADVTVSATFAARTADAPISWGKDGETINLTGDAATLQTLTNEEHLAVTYSSDNTSVANISNEAGHEGEITLVAGGKANISATYTATLDGVYKTTTVTYALTVVAPNFYIAGTFTEWETNKIPVYGESYVIADLEATAYEFKVIDGEAWKGFGNLTTSEIVAGLYGNGVDNVCFTLAEAGDVTITYNASVFKAEGNFVPQTVEIGGSWTTDWSEGKVTAILSGDKKSATAKKTLTKGEWYNFKPVINDAWLGCGASAKGINRTENSVTGFSEGGDNNHVYFQADQTGEYEFTWAFGTQTLTVDFPEKTYAVTFDAPTNGSLTILNGSESIASGDEFVEGTELDVVATPASGYLLATLTANGDDIKSSAKVIIGTADVVVVATFEKDATALDNTEASEKVVKTMENGVLIIRRGDKTYNGQGQLLK